MLLTYCLSGFGPVFFSRSVRTKTGHSAGEDVDDKIRVITALLGVDLSDGEGPPPSFQEIANSVADLRRDAEGVREEMVAQSVSQPMPHSQEYFSRVERMTGPSSMLR